MLELSNFCSSLDGIWTHTIDTLQHHSLSPTSSALDHSTTSTPYIYYGFLKGSSTMNVSIYSENRRGIYFSLLTTIKTWTTKIEIIILHWINCIIRNNMYFYYIKCCFYPQKITHKYQIESANSYVPRLYHNILNITINKTLSLENFRRHGATPRFCWHVANT